LSNHHRALYSSQVACELAFTFEVKNVSPAGALPPMAVGGTRPRKVENEGSGREVEHAIEGE
jgi:hypothetical protein